MRVPRTVATIERSAGVFQWYLELIMKSYKMVRSPIMHDERDGRKIASAWKIGLRMAKVRRPVKENPATRIAMAKIPTTSFATRIEGSCSNVAGSIRDLIQEISKAL